MAEQKGPRLVETRQSPSRVLNLILPTLTVISLGLLAFSSVAELYPGQAAVRLNNFTGEQEALTEPGFVLSVPLVHAVYVLDAAPQTFHMKGEKNRNELEVRELTVRANDGSNFHFDEFTLVFQLAGDQAAEAVRDGGPGNGFLKWMKPYARSILRNEFGRESTIAVSNPSTYKGAAERAKKRLNELLLPHGLYVTQVVTPKPKFNTDYEATIERRNALGNQLDVISSELEKAATERSRKLAEVDQVQNKKIQERRAELEAQLAEATAKQAAARREVDTYRIAKIAEGEATRAAATQRATELAGRLDALYAAKKAEIDAFRTQPIERVMQRIGERLEGVTVNIQPYANDAVPSRVILDK